MTLKALFYLKKTVIQIIKGVRVLANLEKNSRPENARKMEYLATSTWKSLNFDKISVLENTTVYVLLFDSVTTKLPVCSFVLTL